VESVAKITTLNLLPSEKDPDYYGDSRRLELFFYWRIFANFRPEKYDFDQYKGFFMEKMAQIRQISQNFFFQIARFR